MEWMLKAAGILIVINLLLLAVVLVLKLVLWWMRRRAATDDQEPVVRAPRGLTDREWGRVESALIEETGNGEFAAYFVRFWRGTAGKSVEGIPYVLDALGELMTATDAEAVQKSGGVSLALARGAVRAALHKAADWVK